MQLQRDCRSALLWLIFVLLDARIMKVFKPSKAKLISTLLIIVAMWTAHELQDLVGDPLLVRFAPQTSRVIESSGDAVEHVNKTDEADVIRAGILLYVVEITVEVVVSYVFASIIVYFLVDRRSEASNKVLQATRAVRHSGKQALILLVLLLGSCATSPVKTSESRLVPPSRLLPAFSRVSQASPHKAQVTIIRDSGSLNVGVRAKLFIDGAPIALFWSGERVEAFLSPGYHIFGVEGELMSTLDETSSSLDAGHSYHFRITPGESSFKIQPTAEF